MPKQKLQGTITFGTKTQITPEQEEDLKKRLQSTVVLFFHEVREDAEIQVVTQYKKET